MKLEEKVFENYSENEFDSLVTYVGYKEVLLFDVKKLIEKENFKNLVRKVFKESGINIRYRVDLAEDMWIDKSHVNGKVTVMVRMTDKTSHLSSTIPETISNLGLSNIFTFDGNETFPVSELKDISNKFDRVVYEVIIDLQKEYVYDKSQTNGGWKQRVLMWDGSIEEKRFDGIVRLKMDSIDSKSKVHKLIIDAPHGLDIYKIVEQELDISKNWLRDYPMKSIFVYESVDKTKNYLNRKKCSISSLPIEFTVGGLVGEYSIDNLIGL